jgi:hypothetical protein
LQGAQRQHPHELAAADYRVRLVREAEEELVRDLTEGLMCLDGDRLAPHHVRHMHPAQKLLELGVGDARLGGVLQECP